MSLSLPDSRLGTHVEEGDVTSSVVDLPDAERGERESKDIFPCQSYVHFRTFARLPR
jgi:hypothetical protein